MLRMVCVVTVSLGLCCVSASSAGQDGPVEATIRKPKPPPKIEFINENYYGFVTALTRDSITIDSPGWSYKSVYTVAGKRVVETKVIPPQPPKRFPVAASLASGGPPTRPPGGHLPGPADGYWMKDVRIGDRVEIHYSRVDGVDTCDWICIQRRPGGRVPASPGEHHDSKTPYHEWANALQDWEEKGVPVPAKFVPNSFAAGVELPFKIAPPEPTQPPAPSIPPMIPPAKP